MSEYENAVTALISIPLGTRLIIDRPTEKQSQIYYGIEVTSVKLSAIDGTSIKPMIHYTKNKFSTSNSVYGSFYNKM